MKKYLLIILLILVSTIISEKGEGKITINGKGVKRILIDGKEFMTGDTKTALKGLVNVDTDLLVATSAVIHLLFPDC